MEYHDGNESRIRLYFGPTGYVCNEVGGVNRPAPAERCVLDTLSVVTAANNINDGSIDSHTPYDYAMALMLNTYF
jgi:hypothetical protein